MIEGSSITSTVLIGASAISQPSPLGEYIGWYSQIPIPGVSGEVTLVQMVSP